MSDKTLKEQEEEFELPVEEEGPDTLVDPEPEPLVEEAPPVSGLWTYECECGVVVNCVTGQPKQYECGGCGEVHDFTTPKRSRKKSGGK